MFCGHVQSHCYIQVQSFCIFISLKTEDAAPRLHCFCDQGIVGDVGKGDGDEVGGQEEEQRGDRGPEEQRRQASRPI